MDRFPGLPTRITDEALYKLARELSFSQTPIPQTDLPENREFMEDVCDAQEELGNNGEPIQPEDCDVDFEPKQYKCRNCKVLTPQVQCEECGESEPWARD